MSSPEEKSENNLEYNADGYTYGDYCKLLKYNEKQETGVKTIVIHRVTSSKFGNRMKYTKEKTGPYHTGFSHFLCHCITDFFLPIDIQLV